LEKVPCAAEKSVYSVVDKWNILQMSVTSICCVVQFDSNISLLIWGAHTVCVCVCVCVCYLLESGVFKFPTVIKPEPIFPFLYSSVCLLYVFHSWLFLSFIFYYKLFVKTYSLYRGRSYSDNSNYAYIVHDHPILSSPTHTRTHPT
jgi:hypothetical protein